MDAPRADDAVDIGWGLLSLKRRYRGGLACTVDLAIGDRWFSLRFEEDYLDVKERHADHPDAIVRGSLEAFRRLWFAREPASARALQDSGALTVEGRERAWNDVLRALATKVAPKRAAGTLASR